MILHDYFRSAAAFRVRIALNLKGLVAERRFVHLRRGEQRGDVYLGLNPQGLVPTLQIDGAALAQSMAIIEYLEETRPAPPLLPGDALGRARVRAIAQMVACDTHPLGNLRVLSHLRGALGHGEAEVSAWYNHWIAAGLGAIEARLDEPESGRFCHGDLPTLADICLIPQVTNAARLGLDLAPFVRVRQVCEEALQLSAFRAALPINQPDAEQP